jgi:glycosyltransferase involved in cell wall biosynthesis
VAVDRPHPLGGWPVQERTVRIAWLVHQYPPRHIGGTELYTHGLARRARAEGHDVLVIAAHEHPSPDLADHGVREAEHEGVRVVEVAHNLSLAPSVARWEHDNPHVAAMVADVLRRFAPDVVHLTHAMKLGAGVLDVCGALRIPVVVTLSDYWFLCPRHTLFTHENRLCAGPSDPGECFRCARDLHELEDTPQERLAVAERPDRLLAALAGQARIVALSRFQRDLFVRHGVAEEDIELIPHGIEPGGLRPTQPAAPRQRPRLVFVGSLVEHKGPHVAVEALSRAPELDDELVLHGPARPGDRYAQHLAEAALRDPRVRLAGPFAPERFGDVLAGADALLLPAQWYENDPLVVKAALHVGVPVLVSRLGTLAELVRDGRDGWTVAHDDVDAWTEALRRVAARGPGQTTTPRPQPTMDTHWDAVREIYLRLTARPMAA